MSLKQPAQLFYLQAENSLDKHRFSIGSKVIMPVYGKVERFAEKMRMEYERVYSKKYTIWYTYHKVQPPKHFQRITANAKSAVDIEILTGEDTPGKLFLKRHAKSNPTSRIRRICDELNISLDDVEPFKAGSLLSKSAISGLFD